MTRTDLVRRGLIHFWRTHAAVAFGVAIAVAVLTGALLVGSSVRDSLAAIVAGRLGRTDVVIAAETPFTDRLGDRLRADPAIGGIAPVLSLEGVATHQPSGRRARQVSVYGVDDRFFSLHGVRTAAPTGGDVLVSPDLAVELGTTAGDAIVVRVLRPTDVPLDSLTGRRDEIGRSMRLRSAGVLDREAMGEFSLAPQQGPVRAVFVALARLQRDLEQVGRVNTLLVAASAPAVDLAAALRPALKAAVDGDDIGLGIAPLADRSALVATASSGLLPEPTANALLAIAARERLVATPAMTWLANRMTVNGRSVPYSLVTSLGPDAAGDARLATLLDDTAGGGPPIVLTEWAARDLGARAGASLQLEYYRWTDEGRLITESAAFRVAGVVPMTGLAVDRHLAPDYPGISDAGSLSDWDPPFPVDLALVRPIDEDFWDRYRTTPKAFIPLEIGQALWRSRHGSVTSIRLRSPDPAQDLDALAARVRAAAVRAVDPERAGFTIVDVRRQNVAASAGATDFGAYFFYFSFFLVVSALLLAALFFRLGIEQRRQEVGVLRAAGFDLRAIRGLFLREGLVVSAVGAVLGAGLALAWTALMLLGLRTWWIGAVGTTALALHVDPVLLAAGAFAGMTAGALCIAMTVRGFSRRSPRYLLAGGTDGGNRRPARVARLLAAGALMAAAALTWLALTHRVAAAAGFFGAGALILISALAAFRGWLGRARVNTLSGHGTAAIVRLGLGNTAWRPGRSLTATGLVAVAAFLLVSVDAFRKDAHTAGDRSSGTGGFALVAESVLPLVHDPATPGGRESLGLALQPDDPALSGVEIFPARLRPGDDASCLNLYQPKRPRLLGVSDRLASEGRFRFAQSVGGTGAENPWQLLRREAPEGAVPAIVDATSLQYVLHAAVGDQIVIDADSSRPIRLWIVASLADSVLQGEIMIGERAFLALFPDLAGYRVLLVDVPSTRVDEVVRVIEERLEPFGVDAQLTRQKLEAYHRVENTYLSTFQTLGGLGLALGTIGLAAVIGRNVLERRRELALLAASGYRSRDLMTIVVAENMTLVAAGLAIGVFAAAVAILPVLIERGGRPPMLSAAWLGAVALAGVVSSLVATRAVRRLPLLASLRSE